MSILNGGLMYDPALFMGSFVEVDNLSGFHMGFSLLTGDLSLWYHFLF